MVLYLCVLRIAQVDPGNEPLLEVVLSHLGCRPSDLDLTVRIRTKDTPSFH
jgi:hypothetical protein